MTFDEAMLNPAPILLKLAKVKKVQKSIPVTVEQHCTGVMRGWVPVNVDCAALAWPTVAPELAPHGGCLGTFAYR